ncbi:MAG: DNRLRE domain-containing protein [Planctomycetes bacterium]|nr:DNRLRE domain-containing protein [Planctomycetota bacterium]
MDTKKGLKIVCIILAFISARAIAITPTDDATVDDFYPDNNNGDAGSTIVRCINLNPGELDTLLKFDLSSVPPTASVKSATLGLYYWHYNDTNPTGRQLNLYRITSAWSEVTVTWNSRPSFNATVIDSDTVPASYGWMTWNVASSAQAFINGTNPNYGWQIMDTAASGNSMIYFRTKDYADSGYHPYLQLDLDIIFVDENAVGANDGSNWTDAYTDLQDALSVAVSGDEIWVANGTYKPDQGSGNRSATFQLINGVKLYGGFAGGEMALDQRDWENNVTTLSGDVGTGGTISDNSQNVVYTPSAGSTTVIDGFTITAGNNTNSTGGGGMLTSGSPKISNCIFTENSTNFYGGGLFSMSSSPIIGNCEFINNSAYEGGGMYIYEGGPTVTNCTFFENEAERYGGGMATADTINMKVTKCIFSDNVAESGGGMANDGSSPAIVNCIFNDNYTTTGSGGGLRNNEESSPALVNCAFVNNSATASGGGIFNRGESHDDDSAPTLVNCSFGNNSAGMSAGGMYTDNSDEEDDPTVTNCIFWGNTAGFGTVIDQQIDGDSSVVTFSCIQDDNPDDTSIPFGGAANSNIDDDPLFRNAVAGDVRLSGDSPCIEAGNDSAVPADSTDLDEDSNTSEQTPLDLDLRFRFADGNCDDTSIVDMGAYELIWIYLGDLDNDCDVDFSDFGIFSSNWLTGR